MSQRVSKLLDLHRSMLRIRLIEEVIAAKYSGQEMRCPVHLSIGQEAVAVGVCANLGARDQATSAHRSHGHYLAKGGDFYAMLAELYGKKDGCAGGRGGSMHLIDRQHGFVGAVPIVGSTLPIAVGLAWGAKRCGTGALTAVFFGEGATEEGVFSESLNLACLHRLPILFICEDNGFSVYTKLSERRPANFSFEEYFKSHGAGVLSGNGMDAEEVSRLTSQAVRKLKKTSIPQVLYFKTWRYLEHCGNSPDDHLNYRAPKDIDRWAKHDPLDISSRKLRQLFHGFQEWEKKEKGIIGKEIEETFLKAANAPFPATETFDRGIWAA